MTTAARTHERELSSAVPLCEPRGRRLNPDARGWSRVPVHRANLRGGWGRTKRWDYWAILTDDLAISVTYADVDYLGIASVWWAELDTGRSGGREKVVPGARRLSLPDVPGSVPLTYRSHTLDLRVEEEGNATRIWADWREKDGKPGRLTVAIEHPPGHQSVNVVIPWSETRFQYTSKHQARPAHGELIVGDEVRRFGRDEGGDRGAGSDRTGGHASVGPATDRVGAGSGDGAGAGPTGGSGDAWGVLDVGRGRWPYRTRWNWGGGAGRAVAGEVVGIQVGGTWTDGTGATENGVIVDGEVVKLGDELAWDYRWDDPLAPWQVRSSDGALDLTLSPRFDRHASTQALVLATEVHQVFGRWTGHVPGPDGRRIEVVDLLGFAEESRSRW